MMKPILDKTHLLGLMFMGHIRCPQWHTGMRSVPKEVGKQADISMLVRAHTQGMQQCCHSSSRVRR